jgi:hypothetical protein
MYALLKILSTFMKERKLLSLLGKVEKLDKFDGNEDFCGQVPL